MGFVVVSVIQFDQICLQTLLCPLPLFQPPSKSPLIFKKKNPDFAYGRCCICLSLAILFNKMVSNSIYFRANDIILFFFMAEHNLLCKHATFSLTTHLSTDI